MIKVSWNLLQKVIIEKSDDCQLFRLKKGKEGSYQIWTKETLEEYGFYPEKSAYYVVLQFDNQPVSFSEMPQIKQRKNTFRAKVCPLSDFIGIR